MQAGESYAFRFQPKGGHYQIALLSALTTTGTPATDSAPVEPTSGDDYADSDILRLSRDALPEGVIFDSAQLGDDTQASQTNNSDWSAPILFYPDGATSDAVVTLANSHGAHLRVTLRGLTGISRTAEVEAAQ
jgi:hypothetical protein